MIELKLIGFKVSIETDGVRSMKVFTSHTPYKGVGLVFTTISFSFFAEFVMVVVVAIAVTCLFAYIVGHSLILFAAICLVLFKPLATAYKPLVKYILKFVLWLTGKDPEVLYLSSVWGAGEH